MCGGGINEANDKIFISRAFSNMFCLISLDNWIVCVCVCAFRGEIAFSPLRQFLINVSFCIEMSE